MTPRIALRPSRPPRLRAVPFFIWVFTIPVTPAAANPLAPIWTGLYGGIQAGATWGDIDTTSFGSLSDTAAEYGLHAGYNLGLGGFVLGLEGDVAFDGAEFGLSLGGGGRAELSTDWSGTVRARLGVPIGPALLYATAGYAWSYSTLTESTGGGRSSGETRFDGVVYGLGVESFVLPQISVRLEALRFDYAAEDLSLGGASAALDNFDPDETVVRAGVTIHLN